jgi:hypothetical protein
MSHSAILLKVGLVNFIFFQLRNEGIHNIVTVPLGVESLRKKKWVRLCAYVTFQPKHQTSLHAATTRGMHGDCVHTRHVSFDSWCTRQMEVCLVCEECDIQYVLSFMVKKV